MHLARSFTVLMYLSISGTCSFSDALFSDGPSSAISVVSESNSPSALISDTMKPLWLYICNMFFIAIILCLSFLLVSSSAVPNLIVVLTDMKKGIILTNMMSMHIVRRR